MRDGCGRARLAGAAVRESKLRDGGAHDIDRDGG